MGKKKTYKSKFTTALKVEILHDKPKGRKVKLLQDLVYWDNKGVKWVAPKGSIVDGASVPRLLWRATGSPYVGLYRRASVIHDVYCDARGARPGCLRGGLIGDVPILTAKQVHQVFKEMMLTDGVNKFKAQYMYWAVSTFGPRW